jgi:hypothetical protein
MKIYIEEFISTSSSSQSILVKDNTKVKKLLNNLEAYLFKKQNIIDIYSKQGMYQVNENQIHKLYIKSENKREDIILNTQDEKNITLIIDDSLIEKQPLNQLPYEHINIPLVIHSYSLNNKNSFGLVLVIEFIENLKEPLKEYNNINNMKPINYYFEYTPLKNSKMGDTNIPLEDINVFLSLLN